ncbi:MAG: DNA cytosine methyltransferase [Acidobacteriia bacterium]|nr:DNA cytosine methyltransferase [Terriglobia bacterium]
MRGYASGISTIPVLDLFAGPGGLGEGFSALRDSYGNRAFKIALSIEKDPFAHETLLLRSFFRQFPDREKPALYYEQIKSSRVDWPTLSKEFPAEAEKAQEEVWQAELGGDGYPASEVDRRIRNALGGAKTWVLIGGPPCQVYSQVGRSRIKGASAWHYARDKRHLLYKEYLRIIAVHRPPVFVMENVKGLLSSKKYGKKIIQRIICDLQHPREAGDSKNGLLGGLLEYKLYSLAKPNEQPQNGSTANDDPAKYVIRSENHGVPQARHRLILVGVRSDIGIEPKHLPDNRETITMWKAIQDLPALRSRLSRTQDSDEAWADAVQAVLTYKTLERPAYRDVRRVMEDLSSELDHLSTGGEYMKSGSKPAWERNWFFDERLEGVCNHSARSHIPEDLWRYFYASCFATLRNRSPILDDFPSFLLPAHKNAKKGRSDNDDTVFADRFRVQLKHRPSTTITSHISKDGHYFIHPDPTQCRSLTVREAARLQTFPDNYYFMGPRTAQYHQVGNAVPPLLALQIAEIVLNLFS